jgi:glutamate-1-semialdehyde 2,1-aminomutase
LKERRHELYPRLAAAGDRLASLVQEHCDRNDMAATLMHAASMHCMHFVKGPISSYRDIHAPNRAAESAFYTFLLERGVLVPGLHIYFLSAAHDEAAIEHAAAAFIESLDDCRADGLL